MVKTFIFLQLGCNLEISSRKRTGISIFSDAMFWHWENSCERSYWSVMPEMRKISLTVGDWINRGPKNKCSVFFIWEIKKGMEKYSVSINLTTDARLQCRKELMGQGKETKQLLSDIQKLWYLFLCNFYLYALTVISRRGTGHFVSSRTGFEIFLIFPNFLSRLATCEATRM